MGVGTCVVRVILVGVVPVLVLLVGYEPGPAVILLSVLAAVFEVVATGLSDLSNGGKRGRGKEKNVRPLKSFPLQLAVIYIVQLWFLLLRNVSSVSPTASPSAADSMPEAGGSVAHAAPVPPLPQVLPNVQPEPVHVALTQAAAVPAAVPVARVPPARGRPYAKTIAEGFEVEAPMEDLIWSPRTISVVLPCAEEREFAINTVKAVFKNTPSDVLHEIVVVDDGSQPPLSTTHLKPEVQKQYKVNIQRHDQTQGLIKAKKTGGDAATGDIIVFFDCHVGPQPNWHEDFINLISQNYRRMVIPQITALDIDSWTQMGGGGGMSKCYVTWDGDFKWGGTDDMYMGMLSGGLAGMSNRWWQESGGYDDQMLGWGGENIDQGIRMWVCGGEIVAAPSSQVAHMWRTGEARTSAKYKRVGDTSRNRARAMYAWMGEFSEKLNDFPMFFDRKRDGGDHWYGDMSNFQKVKDILRGVRPFAWYLRRFKVVYEDAGMIPKQIFMIREETSGQCLLYQGHAGTSGNGKEGVALGPCDKSNHRFYWHPGNRSPKTGKCCSGLKAWNTDQCLEGGQAGGRKGITGICEIGGHNGNQYWRLHADGSLKRGDSCLGPGDEQNTLKEAPCFAFRSKGGAKFTKIEAHEPIETTLYDKAHREHPELFKALEDKENKANGRSRGPRKCQESGIKCVTLVFSDGSKRCIDDEGSLTDDADNCAVSYIQGRTLRHAERGDCLDMKSDQDAESYVWYSCHGGNNQNYDQTGGRWCAAQQIGVNQCFDTPAEA